MEARNGVGFIVPTLGRRPNMLTRVLKSLEPIADEIIVVAPKHFWVSIAENADGIKLTMVRDPEEGLAAAINEGLRNLGHNIEFANWIGDDDGLYSEKFLELKRTLVESDAVAAFGDCDYKLENGNHLGRSSAGTVGVRILEWGPDLIPQPTSLFRLDALRAVEMIDETYKLAFDYDLFLKLKSIGNIIHFPEATGYFTWHSDSLSVANRLPSAREAHLIRMRHARGISKLIIGVISPLVFVSTVVAGYIVNIYSNRIRESK